MPVVAQVQEPAEDETDDEKKKTQSVPTDPRVMEGLDWLLDAIEKDFEALDTRVAAGVEATKEKAKKDREEKKRQAEERRKRQEEGEAKANEQEEKRVKDPADGDQKHDLETKYDDETRETGTELAAALGNSARNTEDGQAEAVAQNVEEDKSAAVETQEDKNSFPVTPVKPEDDRLAPLPRPTSPSEVVEVEPEPGENLDDYEMDSQSMKPVLGTRHPSLSGTFQLNRPTTPLGAMGGNKKKLPPLSISGQ